MRTKRVTVLLALCITIVSGLTGCGGGGSSATFIYRGNNVQAVVTTGNAKALSVDAIQGAQNVTEVGVLGKRAIGKPEKSIIILSIARILEGCVNSIYSKPVVTKTAAKTVAATVHDTQYGTNGSFSYSLNANNLTGSFSGTITFNAYQSDSYSPTISGDVSLSGAINVATGDLIRINMSMSDVHTVSGSESNTLNGSVSMSTSGTATTLDMSVVLIDNAENKTYWLKDFRYVLAGDSMTISGTYYDHVYGYVVVTTVSPLTVADYSSTPTSGQLLFTGDNGTKARLTYAGLEYLLEADVSGSGTYSVIP